jgi:hypothetical protein
MSEPSFWQSSWEWVKRAFRAVAAPLPAILLIVGAIILVILGAKNIQIGGLLGKLLGKEKAEGKKVIDVANSIPEGRVDPNGNIIQPGTPDSQGITQAKVVPIEKPGLFDDPTQVKITPPGETKPIVVDLPDGVKAADVDKVIVVQPEVYVVTVKDTSKVTPKKVDDLLQKYGG